MAISRSEDSLHNKLFRNGWLGFQKRTPRCSDVGFTEEVALHQSSECPNPGTSALNVGNGWEWGLLG